MDLTGLKGQFSMREFVVDFFGSLMPGVLFLFLLIPCFILPIISTTLILQNRFQEYGDLEPILDVLFWWISDMPAVAILAVFFIFLATGYVIGTLFYRRDPKVPDHKSLIRIASKFKKKEDFNDWVVKIRTKSRKEVKQRWDSLTLWAQLYYLPLLLWTLVKLKEKVDNELTPTDEGGYITDSAFVNFLTVHESEVQFPYNNLQTYFKARNRMDLGRKITWSVDNQTERKRSKTFINSFKIKVQFQFPEKTGTINKNEAHIRLTSSMWYASRTLIGLGLLAFVTMFVSHLYIYNSFNVANHIAYPLLMTGGVIVFSFLAKFNSEKFLHYQRVREIFYVLETASIAENETVR